MGTNNNIDSSSVCKWIFESASFGVITTDNDLVVNNVNHWFENYSEKLSSQFKGKSLFGCFPEIEERGLEHYFSDALNGASAALSPRLHKYVFRLPSPLENDKDYMQQAVRISPLISDNKITGIIILVEDVTERIRREGLLNRKNEELQILNSTKDRFFSIIAHDLRSPFNALIGFSEVLRDDVTLTQAQTQDIVNTLHSSLKNQFSFLENLLKWAQLQSGRIDIVPVEFVLKEVTDHILHILSPAIESKQISMNIDLPGNVTLFTDKQSVTTVLHNLVSNAIKFTEKGGIIEIGSVKSGKNTMVFVKDSGVGIGEEMVFKLFRIEETFTTAGTNNEKGSGLGLILCRELVEKLGGKIWVKSMPGQGSTFFFSIPDSSAKFE